MTTKKIRLPGFLLTVLMLWANYFPATAQTPDPGLMGTHTVIKAEYNLGNLSYAPPPAAMFPSNMEEIGSIHYPADLTSGPFPVILFLHGRHETCYDSVTLASGSGWPCTGVNKPIVSYEGYDYVAKTLASHGYIVISISANAINAIDGGLGDAGMNARGVLVQHHLDLWKTWNTVGGAPFGTTFVGKLNMQNIGTMGHSRGGEGVVFNAQYNRSLGSPYGIRAVLTLAPVDFYRHVLNGIPLLDIAPYCDGDVNDLQGIHFYDDARYNDTTDITPKHTILFLGANHDFFNTVWTPGSYVAGGADDWGDYGWSNSDPQCGALMPSRFDTTKEKAALNAYLPAFFRNYIGNETQFAPILEVNNIVPPASSTLDSSNVFVSYHPGHQDRLDINRTDSLTRLTTNTLTGAVTQFGLTTPAICGGGYTMPTCDGGPAAAQRPHRGSGTTQGLAQMRIKWSDTTNWYENAIPAVHENFTSYENLLFRAAVNFSETSPGPNLNFTVQLIDSAGNKSSQVVSNRSHTLFYQPGTMEPTDLPKLIFNTVNFPLSGFTGVDLSRIRNVKFLFNKSMTGAVVVSDIALTNPICGNFNADFHSHRVTGNNYAFTDSSTVSNGDTLSWYWNFGDPTTGLNDTSTLRNPNHLFSGSSTYTVCLYTKTRRKSSGLICADTFCTTISTLTLNTPVQSQSPITIAPNPAKDFLFITGADKTDVLKLVNLYGQVVFSAVISDPVVHLPLNLPSGFYYAMVASAKGNVYKKLLITQ